MAIANQETRTRLEGLMEVILHVKDMNAQVSFYRDKLGLNVSHPRDTRDYGKEGWVTFDTGRCVLALHDGGKARYGEPPSHRIVFQVKDIRATREQLVNRGVPLSDLRSPAPGVWVVDGKDPEGNVYALESHD